MWSGAQSINSGTASSPTLSFFSTYLAQGRPRASAGASDESELQGTCWAPLFTWSPLHRQHGEEGRGQSSKESLLPALGVTAGEKSTFFPEVPLTGLPESWREYLTAGGISEAARRRMRVKCPLPQPFPVSTNCNTHTRALEPSDTRHPPSFTGSNLSTALYHLAWRQLHRLTPWHPACPLFLPPHTRLVRLV